MANKGSVYTQKSLKYARNVLGLKCETVEKFVAIVTPDCPFGFRKDLFNIIDIIGINDTFTYGIQSTSYKQRAEHLVKMKMIFKDNLADWVRSPHRKLILISWKKEKIKRGGIAFRYIPIIDEL